MRNRREPDWAVWHAPAVFTLMSSGREKLMKQIRALRRLVSEAKGPLRLDFSATSKLHSGAMLLFSAELRRLFKHFPGVAQSVRCNVSKVPKVQQVFKQIGLLKLLRRSSWIQPTDSDVVHWKFTHGNKVEGVKFEEVLGELTSKIEDQVQTELYEGFIEAMNNVLHHAYIGIRQDGLNVRDDNEWWMFSQQKDDKITVVFCDLGLGIPTTLPVKKEALWKRLVSLNLTSDADVIEHALEDSVTRTRKEERGKGLKQLVDVVSQTAIGEVAIFSNRGALFYKVGGVIKKQNYSDSIFGTLIHWTIPVLRTNGVSAS